jgi:hypothetical protein
MSKAAILQALRAEKSELCGALFIHEGPTGILVTGQAPSETAIARLREVVERAAVGASVDFRVKLPAPPLVVLRDAPEEAPRTIAKREKVQMRRKELSSIEAPTEAESTELIELLAWLQANPPLESFALDASTAYGAFTPTGDRVRVLAQLSMAPTDLLERATGKARASSVSSRLDAAIEQGGVIAPIIADSRLRIIDGRWRLLNAFMSGISTVPVVIVEATEKQALSLRIALNKSAEFQRWHWDEVDAFLDNHADEYLSVLEPLGIFGERIIPQSFLGNTVLEYRIHDAEGMDTQQKFYKQEQGLAKWAEIARNELAAAAAQKLEVKQAKASQQAPQEVSLFG